MGYVFNRIELYKMDYDIVVVRRFLMHMKGGTLKH